MFYSIHWKKMTHTKKTDFKTNSAMKSEFIIHTLQKWVFELFCCILIGRNISQVYLIGWNISQVDLIGWNISQVLEENRSYHEIL